jgi:23S rRNA (cytosine1962-C5)-methyltransferase
MALVIYEDEHLLVVNKPAGLNTHGPNPYAGEGLYDWLRDREPRWASLAIIHRLDKETSGVIVFSKTPLANRSLTQQFTARLVRKRYSLLTDRPLPREELVVKTTLARAGEKYVSRPRRGSGESAETRFRLVGTVDLKPAISPDASLRKWGSLGLLEAEPLTGRTHQIRVHAAESGFPILGDTLYGGTPALRVYLHARQIIFRHPGSGEELSFFAPEEFEANPRQHLRQRLIDEASTNVCRLIHGASDGWDGWYVDRLGDYLLSQGEHPLSSHQEQELARLLGRFQARAAYHKLLTRRTRQASLSEASPRVVRGEMAPERFTIRENGLQFELSFNEGYSVGLFLDQRENRRRSLTGHIGAGFSLFPEAGGTGADPGNADKERQDRCPAVLNTFAYTCGFSVAAARAGFHTTSLDLSRKYLNWGRRNFALNGLDIAEHEFIYGDVFEWLRRFAKRGRVFDVILLDPPTFSQSKAEGIFRAEKDYERLARAALLLLRPGGVLFASTNAADWRPEDFVSVLEKAIHSGGRVVGKRHYVPQPPDFPVSRSEPAYLKSIWLRVN